MDGVSHMSQNEKFAAVELAKAGLGQKHEKRKTRDFQRGNHENRSKSLETSHTLNLSTKACLGVCKLLLMPKGPTPDTSHEKNSLSNEIMEINDQVCK